MVENQSSTVFPHVGMHKTGSSSIQSTLYNNALDQNYYYIKISENNRANQGSALEYIFGYKWYMFLNPIRVFKSIFLLITFSRQIKFALENEKNYYFCGVFVRGF